MATRTNFGPLAVTPYGRIGFEIQGLGRSLAVVNYVSQKRLDYLDDTRSAKAKRGEPAHAAEREARTLEDSKLDALALARLMAAAPDLLAALQHLMRYDFGDSDGAKEARAAIALAIEGIR